MKPEFTGIVKQGKVRLDRPEAYLVHISKLEGYRVVQTLEKERNLRSLSQNRYYWGVVIEILAEEFGYEREEMHEALKMKFLRKHDDTKLPTVGSTARMNTAQFSDYIDRVMRWAATDYSIYIPEIGE